VVPPCESRRTVGVCTNAEGREFTYRFYFWQLYGLTLPVAVLFRASHDRRSDSASAVQSDLQQPAILRRTVGKVIECGQSTSAGLVREIPVDRFAIYWTTIPQNRRDVTVHSRHLDRIVIGSAIGSLLFERIDFYPYLDFWRPSCFSSHAAISRLSMRTEVWWEPSVTPAAQRSREQQ
jgi:hypothetical protein